MKTGSGSPLVEPGSSGPPQWARPALRSPSLAAARLSPPRSVVASRSPGRCPAHFTFLTASLNLPPPGRIFDGCPEADMNHWKETAEILSRLADLKAAGRRAALATVTHIVGSPHPPPGGKVLLAETGRH